MAKPTARTVTPPTARVPPTAAAKSGANKGSSENNVQQAQIDDLSNQVRISCPVPLRMLDSNSFFCFRLDAGDRFEIELGRT